MPFEHSPAERPPERASETARSPDAPVDRERVERVLRIRPHIGKLLLPGKEKDDLKTQHALIDKEYDDLARMRDAVNAGPNRDNERSLAVAVAAYEEHRLDFDMKRDMLVHATAKVVADNVGLPDADKGILADTLQHRIVEPPESAPDDVKSRHAAIVAQREAMVRLFASVILAATKGAEMAPEKKADIAAAWARYKTEKIAFDDAADEIGARELSEMLGISGTVKDVRTFIADVTSPLASLANASEKVRKNPVMLALREKLESQRLDMAVLLPTLMRRGIKKEDGEQWSWNVTRYLLDRGAYQAAVLGKVNEGDQWMMYGTVVMQELTEEAAEMIPGLELKRMEFLRGLTGPVRLRVLTGLRELRMQGVPAKMLGQVLESFGRSPLGPKFWTELFKVESGATILLWGLYLHNSPNKLQASIQFGSFIALSNAVNKLSAPVLEALGAMKIASRFKVPGLNFALQFGIAMAAAYVAGDKIVEFSNWVDETIPDSSLKHKATTVLSIVSGEPIFSGIEDISEMTGATGLLDKAGLTGFDPDRDLMAYLGTEAIRGGEWGSGGELELDYRYTRTMDDWNNRLKQAISAQDNVVQQKLWETLRVDGGEWASRQALQLFSAVTEIRRNERSLEEELRAAKILGAAEKLPGLDIATMDAPAEKKAASALRYMQVTIGDDLTNRNDRITARAFDGDPILLKASKYYAALPAADPKRLAWKEYERACKDTAKKVSVYRHVDVYARKAWLGDVSSLGEGSGLEKVPASVRAGLLAEVRHQIARRETLRPEAFPELTRAAFREKLVGVVKFKEKLSFLETGFMLVVRNAELQGTERAARDAYVSLLFAVQDAQKTLPDDAIERALQPIRELALAGRVATSKEIQLARSTLHTAILDHETKGLRLGAATPDIRKDLGIPEGTPVLLQGPAEAATYEFTRTVLDLKFFFNATETEVPSVFRPFENLKTDPEFDDLHVARTRDDGAFFRNFQHFAFDCSSSDRRQWRVQVNQGSLTTQHFKKEEGVKYRVSYSWKRDPTVTIPFADWQKANMDVAMQLEQPFKGLQAKEREREAKYAAAKELEKLQERVLQGELSLYMAATQGVLDSPSRLANVPPRLARDPVFAPAYERQMRIEQLWQELDRGGMSKIFEEWGKSMRQFETFNMRMMGRFDEPLERRGLSVGQIANGVRVARGKTTWVEHEAFLNRAATYARLYAEQKAFLEKTPIPKPYGPQLPQR